MPGNLGFKGLNVEDLKKKVVEVFGEKEKKLKSIIDVEDKEVSEAIESVLK